MARVAFIGLGNMGGGMAANLAAKGEEVVAFDLAAPALERAQGNGCSIATSAEEAVAGADVVVTMLPAGKHVASVYRDCHSWQGADQRPADRLLDHRRRHRQVGRGRGGGGGLHDGRCAGVGRDRGGRRGHADLHGRRIGRGFRARQGRARQDGQGGDPCRRRGRGPGGQDLQQHAARRDHGRDLRGVRAGGEARARRADLFRHFVQGERPELVDDKLLPRPRRRPRNARPTAITTAGSPRR